VKAERCLETEELGDVLESDPGDPRRRHVRVCPRCAARLAAYQEFLALRGEAKDAREEDAAARLNAFVEEAVLGGAPWPQDAPAMGPLRQWLASLARPHRLVPACAGVLAVAILALIVRPWEAGHDAPLRLRGEEAAAAVHTFDPVPGENGTLLLRWSAVPGAQTYVVVILSPGFLELGRLEAGADTVVAIGPATLPQRPFRGFWQVRAAAELAEVSRSRPAPLVLPAP